MKNIWTLIHKEKEKLLWPINGGRSIWRECGDAHIDFGRSVQRGIYDHIEITFSEFVTRNMFELNNFSYEKP